MPGHLFDLRMVSPEGVETIQTFPSMKAAADFADDWMMGEDTSIVRETLVEIGPHESEDEPDEDDTDETDPTFRLTIHHDDDAEVLNPNDRDSPLFKLHSFSNRHFSFTDPDVLLACQFEFPEGHEDEGFQCDEMPTPHDGERISDHKWVGPEGFFLSYFEHGQCRWGLSGSMSGMPDFRWDGVEFAGYLEIVVPDDEREWWDNRPEEDRVKAAESFVSEYTDWCNGDIYGYNLERINPSKCNLGFTHESPTDEDSCWGFIGFDYFQDAVREATTNMGATESNTEIVDKAYGAADYGEFFTTETKVDV